MGEEKGKTGTAEQQPDARTKRRGARLNSARPSGAALTSVPEKEELQVRRQLPSRRQHQRLSPPTAAEEPEDEDEDDEEEEEEEGVVPTVRRTRRLGLSSAHECPRGVSSARRSSDTILVAEGDSDSEPEETEYNTKRRKLRSGSKLATPRAPERTSNSVRGGANHGRSQGGDDRSFMDDNILDMAEDDTNSSKACDRATKRIKIRVDTAVLTVAGQAVPATASRAPVVSRRKGGLASLRSKRKSPRLVHAL